MSGFYILFNCKFLWIVNNAFHWMLLQVRRTNQKCILECMYTKTIECRIKGRQLICNHLFRYFETTVWLYASSTDPFYFFLILNVGHRNPEKKRWQKWFGGLWCFSTTFDNISVLLVEKTTDLSQVTDKLLSPSFVSSTPPMNEVRTRNASGDKQWLHR